MEIEMEIELNKRTQTYKRTQTMNAMAQNQLLECTEVINEILSPYWQKKSAESDKIFWTKYFKFI